MKRSLWFPISPPSFYIYLSIYISILHKSLSRITSAAALIIPIWRCNPCTGAILSTAAAAAERRALLSASLQCIYYVIGKTTSITSLRELVVWIRPPTTTHTSTLHISTREREKNIEEDQQPNLSTRLIFQDLFSAHTPTTLQFYVGHGILYYSISKPTKKLNFLFSFSFMCYTLKGRRSVLHVLPESDGDV